MWCGRISDVQHSIPELKASKGVQDACAITHGSCGIHNVQRGDKDLFVMVEIQELIKTLAFTDDQLKNGKQKSANPFSGFLVMMLAC